MSQNFQKHLLSVTKSEASEEIEIIQSLWSGYGKVSRYRLVGSSINSVVVKHIALQQSDDHPRGWNTDLSHNRKVKSYQVETNWYKQWSQSFTLKSKIPTFIGSFSEGNKQWIILEDLNHEFPLRKDDLSYAEVKVCLQWLAHFHAVFLNQQPTGLWEIGTYWHLATRPDEFEKIENKDLKSKAHLIDEILNQCRHQTIVHGDAKLANFCFSEKGENVAAVDFQYVGGGCGMKDVAYFLGSCLSSFECELYETEFLDFYFVELERALKSRNSTFEFNEIEKEWRCLYPIACVDFTRFLLGWMPSHQKVNKYNLDIMKTVLSSLSKDL